MNPPSLLEIYAATAEGSRPLGAPPAGHPHRGRRGRTVRRAAAESGRTLPSRRRARPAPRGSCCEPGDRSVATAPAPGGGDDRLRGHSGRVPGGLPGALPRSAGRRSGIGTGRQDFADGRIQGGPAAAAGQRRRPRRAAGDGHRSESGPPARRAGSPQAGRRNGRRIPRPRPIVARRIFGRRSPSGLPVFRAGSGPPGQGRGGVQPHARRRARDGPVGGRERDARPGAAGRGRRGGQRRDGASALRPRDGGRGP